MEWNDLPDSSLANELNAKKLAHPTNASFDPVAWVEAIAALADPSQRDVDLTFAAIHYGHQLGSLREYNIPLITQGFSRQHLVRLAAAYANQQYMTLTETARTQLKAVGRKTGVYDFERAQQQFVSNVAGQEMTADDHIVYLVDSLPHWLFHIWKVAEDAPIDEPEDAFQFAGRAMAIASIERSLRHLWLCTLWNGNAIEKTENKLIEGPRDRAVAERWFAWDLRQQMLLSREHRIDAASRIFAGGKLPPVKPAFGRTVIRVEWPQSEHRRFIVGNTSGVRPEQRGHVSERDMLEAQYTGAFLDEPLPRSPRGSFTCRELSTAWWVLQDLARVASNDLGKAWMPDDTAIGRFAITVERKDLAKVFSQCLSIDPERGGEIVDWLTCDPNDTGRLFAKSFWSEPLLPAPDSELRHILLAPLLTGAPLKRIEAWMERGGISDNQGVKGRGKPFEKYVRSEIATVLAANCLLTDTVVAEHGLKRKGESEEIDLLVRVGDAVLVGEVKCFVAPSEPTDKHNHLGNLSKATEQGKKKRAWAQTNREKIGIAVGVTDPARLAALTIIPVVVLNNGMGIGLERDGVPVVDLHYLRLLLSSGSYQSGARFERGVGVTSEIVKLYASQAELETNLMELLRTPPPLKRFDGALRWRQVPFPTSFGGDFFMELPALSVEPPPNLLRDMPFQQEFRKDRLIL